MWRRIVRDTQKCAIERTQPGEKERVDLVGTFLLGPVPAPIKHVRRGETRNFAPHRGDGIAAPQHIESRITRTGDEKSGLLDLPALETQQIFEIAVVIAIAVDRP